MSTRHATGWLIHVACGDLDRAAIERLCDSLWQGHPVAVEERDGEIVAGYSDEGSALVALALVDAPARLSTVEDDSYLDEWKRHARPQRVGHVGVRLPWHAPIGAPIEVVIDPRRSFGSGAHPSTRLVIELMQNLSFAGATVLDMGAGSGILSIVAARLGAARVIAVDNDPQALVTTQLNAARNGVASIVEPALDLTGVAPGSVDLTLANVLVATHRELAPMLMPLTRQWIIASGALDDQCDALRQCYRHLAPLDAGFADGWVALSLHIP